MQLRAPVSLALLLVSLIIPGMIQGASAQGLIFQWLDDEGRVVYSDLAPLDREFREVQALPGPTPEDAAAARERAEAVQRLADQFREERRREERVAPAPAAPYPGEAVMPGMDPSWYGSWYPPYPRRRGGSRYPWHGTPGWPTRPPLGPGHPPPGHVTPRPYLPDFTPLWRDPAFGQPWFREPEFAP
jgi:hypothetical protein